MRVFVVYMNKFTYALSGLFNILGIPMIGEIHINFLRDPVSTEANI